IGNSLSPWLPTTSSVCPNCSPRVSNDSTELADRIPQHRLRPFDLPQNARASSTAIIPGAATRSIPKFFSTLLVISRNTAFTYKGQHVDAKQIGRDLGVRYVLEGSVRRSGNQVRVNAQLIDAETNTHLWAEHFDHDIGDLFAMQSEITTRIANT